MSLSSEVEHRPLLEANRQFYNGLWSEAKVVEPHRFNTWPLVQSLVAAHPRRLEVAPGLRPRLPIADTCFVDISAPALDKLAARGGRTTLAPIYGLPFAERSFDLVCALDIIEHVDEDEQAMFELARVAAPGAALLVSVPLHQALWTPFDDFVGHRRRYEPQVITSLLSRNGFTITHSAVFGMQPRSSHITNLGMWFLQNHRRHSMWWYNKVMPFTLRLQKALQLRDGLMDMDEVSDILLVCRRQ